MEFRKSPPKLVAAFEAVVPGPPTQSRMMFGYPAAFVNGNMFMGLFAEHMFLRLPEGERAKLLKTKGASTFEPMAGRPMKEYVVVPPSLLTDPAKLRGWVAKALAHGRSLPPKAGKKSPAKKKR